MQLGRDGQFDASLHQLYRLRQTYPDHQGLLGDLVVILLWADRPGEALAQAAALDLAVCPDYVLAGIARAARDLKQFDRAADYYRRAAVRFPDQWPFRLGQALSLAEAGDSAAAHLVYQDLLADQPATLDVLLGGGYLYRLQRAPLEVLTLYSRALALDPTQNEAYRWRVLALSELGAAYLAQSESLRRPELFSAEEQQRLHGNLSAAAIRWEGLTEAERETESIDSLSRFDQALANWPTTAAAHRRARLDRLLALDQRQALAEVLAEYQALHDTGEPLPAYALMVVASAYLSLRQPAQAATLYQQILLEQPDNFDAQMGLFYAYIEAEQFDAAYTLIDRLAATQPVWRRGAEGGPQRPNRRKLDTDVAAALVRAFGNQLAEAQARLEPLVTEAPLNATLRGELASVYRQRGWPQRALAEYERARAVDSEVLTLELGQIGTLLDLNRPEAVAARIETLADRHPDNRQVQRLQRDWTLRNGWLLSGEAGYGQSSGSTFGSEDWSWSTVLSAPPLDWHYRPFLHAYYAHATFPEGSDAYDRLGVGVDYAHNRWYGKAELSADRQSGADAGLEAELGWQPDDRWRFAARLATFSTEVPLRGYRQGIEGAAYRLSAGYAVSESRSFSTAVDYLDFSDGNERRSGQIAWRERLLSEPHRLLTGALELYGSSNSRTDVPYFSPSRDLALTLALTGDWISYRHYEQRLTQRLVLSPGLYWQENVGSNAVGALRYEHDWTLDAATSLRYGLGWASHVYDGNRESRVQAYAAFEWRF